MKLKPFFKKKPRPAEGNGDPVRLFVHIPKTAGTSFRTVTESHFGRSRVLRDYGLDSDTTSQSIREEIYQKKHCPDLERAVERDNAVLVAGHVPITKYGGQIGLQNTMTLFRDPVEQVISHYRHAVRNQGYQGGLISFARSERARNVQSHMMADIDPALVGIVGLTESYRETLAIIESRWGWGLRHKKKNVSGKLSIRPFEVCNEDRAEVERLNQADRLLYARACQVFSNTWRCFELGSGADPRGAITRADIETGLSGWAFYMLSDTPAEVEILVNGTSRVWTHCDYPVPELLPWNLPRNGRVGFRVKMDTLEIGNTVELRDINSGLILASQVFGNPG